MVWLVAGAGRPLRRVLDVGAAIGLAALLSLSWMVAVSLVPEAARPYVDGSTHDSVFQQVFVYNGFGRVGTVARHGRPRADPLRAGVILFGTWLAIDAAAFSALSGINAYYLAALTPAIAALIGIGTAVVLRAGTRDRLVRGSLLLASGATVLSGLVLSGPAPTAVLAFVCCGATALLVGGWWLLICPLDRWTDGHDPPATDRRVRTLVGAGLVLGAMALPSLTAAGDIVASGLGPFDTPYEPAGVVHITQTEPREALTSIADGAGLLLRVNRSDRYVAATYTSIIAAPLIIDTGAEIEPIGGFTGSSPSPTVAALRHQVRTHALQTVITPTVDDARIQWVGSHCAPVPQSTGAFAVHGPIAGIGIYFCTARARA